MKNIYLSLVLIFLSIIGCEKIPDSVVDNKNTSVQAIQINAPAEFNYTVFDSSFTTYVEFSNDVDLKSTWVDIYSPKGEKINPSPVFLKDNGVFNDGDMQKGDKKYSCKITLGKNRISGDYQLRYFASDILDNSKELGIHKLTFRSTDQNNPPLISDLSAPDSIKLSDTQTISKTITIKVSDPQGLDDIKNVFFYSTKPDGTLANGGNPFILYDNGDTEVRGDVLAGDGIYSIIIYLSSSTSSQPPQKGTYRFEFQAVDRFDALSNKIIHEVVVY